MESNKEEQSPLTREQAEKLLASMRHTLEQVKEIERTGEIDGVRMSVHDFLGETESVEHLEDEISNAEEYLEQLGK